VDEHTIAVQKWLGKDTKKTCKLPKLAGVVEIVIRILSSETCIDVI
jgi:hypothetical protein